MYQSYKAEVRILKNVALNSMLTQEPKKAHYWKENSLNSPPEQDENEDGDEDEGEVKGYL